MPIPVGATLVEAPDGSGVPGALVHDGQLTLGEITLGVADEFGVEWILEKLTGWLDAPATTGTADQRASDHGGWYSPAYYTPRTVEIEGSLLASSFEAAERAIDRLMAAIPLDLPDWMYVVSGSRLLQAKVRQDGDPLVEVVGGWARFSLSLLSADPRRYSSELTTASTGLPQTTGGLTLGGTGLTLGGVGLTVGASFTSGHLTVENVGNMATRPVLTVTGPCPPFAITHLETGKTLRFVESISAGRSLTIDTDRRRALLDGTAARTVTGTWFEYVPGSNSLAFTASSYDAAAELTSSHRSAWR